MRLHEIIAEINTKNEIDNHAWQSLQQLKDQAAYTGNQFAKGWQKYQLFVPRGMRIPSISKRNQELLKNPYNWDDEGELRPLTAKSQERFDKRDYHPTGKQPDVTEAGPPILSPSRGGQKGDWNKPSAILWTSSARKEADGSWTSEWTRAMSRYKEDGENTQYSWIADHGYLYKIKPGALILELFNEREAENVAYILGKIGKHEYKNDSFGSGTSNFPWVVVGQYFDAATSRGRNYEDDAWSSSWEVESTAWLSSDHLQLVGKVRVSKGDPREDEDGYLSIQQARMG